MTSVTQVEPKGELDNKMIDLVVALNHGFPISQVFVQVKSSHWGIKSFFERVGKEIDKIDPIRERDQREEYLRRREWIAEQRLIVINARDKNETAEIDKYILDKFQRDLAIMIAYRNRLRQYRSDQMQVSYVQSLSDLK